MSEAKSTAGTEIGAGDGLLIVDVQNDFCPGGALPVPDGDAVVPELQPWIEAAVEAGATVVASRDWHPRRHPSFEAEGGRWPAHCVQDSPGAGFHPDLELPDGVTVVSKGTRLDRDQYSAFDETGLAAFLERRGVECVWIGGLALDVCVRATAVQALESDFDVVLLAAASRAIDVADGRSAVAEVREAGGRVVD